MPMPPHVLLLVEDDDLVRLTLVEALADGGFEVLAAGDARSALGLVCDRPDIAALMTDIDLPGADGFALARAARVVRPALPVVYASGRYALASSGAAVAGARFLAKPFAPSRAAALLRDLIPPAGEMRFSPAIEGVIGDLRTNP